MVLRVRPFNGKETIVTISRPVPGLPDVVFSDETMLGPLERTMEAVDTRRVLRFWKEYVPAKPGRWGGFVLASDPRLTSIAFLHAARTQAAADVSVGDAGGVASLEKRRQKWTAVRLLPSWIE